MFCLSCAGFVVDLRAVRGGLFLFRGVSSSVCVVCSVLCLLLCSVLCLLGVVCCVLGVLRGVCLRVCVPASLVLLRCASVSASVSNDVCVGDVWVCLPRQAANPRAGFELFTPVTVLPAQVRPLSPQPARTHVLLGVLMIALALGAAYRELRSRLLRHRNPTCQPVTTKHNTIS